MTIASTKLDRQSEDLTVRDLPERLVDALVFWPPVMTRAIPRAASIIIERADERLQPDDGDEQTVDRAEDGAEQERDRRSR